MKTKTLLLTVVLAFVSGMTMNAQRVLNTERYDVNKDGYVTITDVTLLVNAMLGKTNYLVEEIAMFDDMVMGVGENRSKTLKPIVIPSDADYLTLFWTSSDETVAMVDQTGKVTGITEGTCTITASAMDGSGVSAACEVTIKVDLSGNIDGRDYVDLGLPSGTLWATCNIGADTPEERGDYFAWGETATKSDYSFSTYQYCNGDYNKLTKYCNNSSYGDNGYTDELTELVLEDDAAYTNWGPNWRMPSLVQFEELINSNYTTTKMTTQGLVYGRLITSKSNGKSIFLPVTDHYGNGVGYYWSSSLDTSNPRGAHYMHFSYYSGIQTNSKYRYGGDTCIRPVRASE